MKISKKNHEMIVDEFKKVETLISESKSIEDKLYFFSASYGILNRIMNIEYDPILVFMHNILQIVHQNFSQRLNASKGSTSISNSIPEEMVNSLSQYLSNLRSDFEIKDEHKIRLALEKFTTLAYSTSGNGFYLYLRGILKL